MNLYTVWATATLTEKPREKRTGKKGETVKFLDLETRLAVDPLPPEALDTTDFFASEPVTIASLWIEKICKVQLLIKNIEAKDLHDLEEDVMVILKANKSSGHLADVEITDIKKQKAWE